MKRQDIHCPSNINPQDYEFLDVHYIGTNEMKQEMYPMTPGLHEAINRHGFGKTDSAGNCHCCGAHALFLGYFLHKPTGKIHTFGERCTENVGMHNKSAFDRLRKTVKGIRDRIAGKQKAAVLFADWGIEIDMEWLQTKPFDKMDLPAQILRPMYYAQDTLLNMYANLVRYGSWSEKQINYAKKLVEKINGFNAEDAEKKRKEEESKLAKIKIEEGRQEIKGTILSTKLVQTMFGNQCKMLIQREDGAKFWGTIPSTLEGHKGDLVKFSAKVTPKQGENGFAFFSRPTKAQILACAA